MIGQNKGRWRKLCEQVKVEQDPKELIELTTEIYRLLEEKRRRIQRNVLWMPRHHFRKERMSQLKASNSRLG